MDSSMLLGLPCMHSTCVSVGQTTCAIHALVPSLTFSLLRKNKGHGVCGLRFRRHRARITNLPFREPRGCTKVRVVRADGDGLAHHVNERQLSDCLTWISPFGAPVIDSVDFANDIALCGRDIGWNWGCARLGDRVAHLIESVADHVDNRTARCPARRRGTVGGHGSLARAARCGKSIDSNAGQKSLRNGFQAHPLAVAPSAFEIDTSGLSDATIFTREVSARSPHEQHARRERS